MYTIGEDKEKQTSTNKIYLKYLFECVSKSENFIKLTVAIGTEEH